MMRKADNNVMFALIAKKLMDGDLDWFRDKVVEEKISFYIQVRVGYSFSHSLSHSIDLGMFPRLYRVEPSQLSVSQQAYLRRPTTKRNLNGEPAKLCSLHEDDCTIADFADCLLYMKLHHSVVIREVLTIVQYTCADFMSDYMQMLQDKRAESTSNVESKMVKALGKSRNYRRRGHSELRTVVYRFFSVLPSQATA